MLGLQDRTIVSGLHGDVLPMEVVRAQLCRQWSASLCVFSVPGVLGGSPPTCPAVLTFVLSVLRMRAGKAWNVNEAQTAEAVFRVAG